MRHLCASAVVIILVLGVLSPPLSVGQTPGSASSGAQLYMGVGSCSAPQCHGSVSPLTTSKLGVRQNEYTALDQCRKTCQGVRSFAQRPLHPNRQKSQDG